MQPATMMVCSCEDLAFDLELLQRRASSLQASLSSASQEACNLASRLRSLSCHADAIRLSDDAEALLRCCRAASDIMAGVSR